MKNKKCLIIISSFLFLLSSCGFYVGMDIPMFADTEYWGSYDMFGNETDNIETTVMWKLKEEKIWVSSLRDSTSYSNKRYQYWREANNFCENSSLYGFNDWRLPTIEELSYLRQKNIMEISNRRGMGDISSYFVWSSSLGSRAHQRAIMGMSLGNIYYEDEDSSSGLFFCIRTGM